MLLHSPSPARSHNLFARLAACVALVALALPALLCGALLRPLLRPPRNDEAPGLAMRRARWVGAAAGALGVLGTGAMLAATLALSGEAFVPAARVIALTFVPLALAEALITAIIVGFLLRVEPELLALADGPADA